MAELTVEQAFELARRHHQAGRLPQAERIYRQILAHRPDHAQALHQLALIAYQVGQNEAAVELVRRAIALKPNSPEAYGTLGDVLSDTACLDEAIDAYRQAIALKPRYAEAHTNLGIAFSGLGRLDEAIAAFRQAIAINPNIPEVYANLGNVLVDRGRVDEALAACRQAIALKPTLPEAHNNLGNALSDAGQLDRAVGAYRQAIALRPDYAEANYNLGTALWALGRLDDAIAAFSRAIALRPSYAAAHNNLGNALKDEGRLDEAILAYRRALALKPDYAQADSNALLALHYQPGLDTLTIRDEHARWSRGHAEPLKRLIQPHHNDCGPDRRLRIGYVSPDFREHPVGRFLLPLLAHHEKKHVEVFAYAQSPITDALTQQLRAHIDHWHSLVGLSDEEAAELIRRHQIDILVDLAGHTAHNRLLVFARRPAPVQVTWLGYPGTTGLGTIDYRLTDAYADPPGLTEACYSEQLVRLCPCAWCYRPTQSPPVSERREGPITFGCFNNFAKVTEPMLALWARIARAVPESRLLLKALGLASEGARQRAREFLCREGMAPERLELRGAEPSYDAHLALYDRMDIALDTFPYHGTNTTCEAMWMGVPVVTLAGRSHVSRVGVSLLSNVGLAEFVADSDEEYVRIAASLANDIPRLADLRRTLRPRMEHSALMDAPGFARNIEAAYREMWHKWCATQIR